MEYALEKKYSPARIIRDYGLLIGMAALALVVAIIQPLFCSGKTF